MAAFRPTRLRRSIAALAALALTVSACGGSRPAHPKRAPAGRTAPVAPLRRGPPFAVGLHIARFVDAARGRTLVTYVRYPARGRAPDTVDGPYPLIVFAHGFTLSPDTYPHLLDAWASAGYVVAAPLLPHTNTNAAVLDRSDLINQPGDLSFLISRLERDATFGRLVDGSRVAVGGHSDGGDTALAVAYDRRFRDPRVRAAVILAGAAVEAFGGFNAGRSPPLLAVQGTADPRNPPSAMESVYAAAPRPKYLLLLLGAGHQAPYQDEQPYLRVVERVSISFLDRYVEGATAPIGGDVRGVSTLAASP